MEYFMHFLSDLTDLSDFQVFYHQYNTKRRNLYYGILWPRKLTEKRTESYRQYSKIELRVGKEYYQSG